MHYCICLHTLLNLVSALAAEFNALRSLFRPNTLTTNIFSHKHYLDQITDHVYKLGTGDSQRCKNIDAMPSMLMCLLTSLKAPGATTTIQNYPSPAKRLIYYLCSAGLISALEWIKQWFQVHLDSRFTNCTQQTKTSHSQIKTNQIIICLPPSL